MGRYIDVILPLAIPGVYTYAWPADLPEVVAGMRVSVPFGRGRKLYGALVRRVHAEAPLHHAARPAMGLLDTRPVVTEAQFLLWERMAAHYLCHLGEVMIAALPAQLALSSETRLVLARDTSEEADQAGRGGMLVDALMHPSAVRALAARRAWAWAPPRLERSRGAPPAGHRGRPRGSGCGAIS